MLRFFPRLGYWKLCYYDHGGADILLNLFLLHLNIFPEVKLLDIAVLFLIFWGFSILFTMVATPTYIPTNSAGGFLFLSPHQGLSLTFQTIAILKGMKWHLTMVLVFISLMTSGAEHLPMPLVPLVYPLWRNVYSDPLPNFYFIFFATELYEYFLCFGY